MRDESLSTPPVTPSSVRPPGRPGKNEASSEDLDVSSSPSLTPASTPEKRRLGFAILSPEQKAEIQSMGGRAAHARGKAHKWNVEQAKAAGAKSAALRTARAAAKQNTDTQDIADTDSKTMNAKGSKPSRSSQ